MAKLIIEGNLPKSCFVCYQIKGTRLKDCPVHRDFQCQKYDVVDALMESDDKHPACPIIGEIPEEHGTYIDVDATIEDFCEKHCRNGACDEETCDYCAYPDVLEFFEKSKHVLLEATDAKEKKMTNREWLETLTDEEFADWATGCDNWDWENNKPLGLHPHRRNIESQYTSAYGGILLWLRQERIEVNT